MADKYIIHGAAFNGDGTSSAEAASNGAAGAWNTITYLEGATPAYGSIAAGDRIFIRSKTAAGADIVRTVGATVTLGVAAGATWILDGGTVWAGVSGSLRYESTGNFALVLTANNRFLSEVKDAWEYKSTTSGVALAGGIVQLGLGAVARNWKYDLSSKTAGGGAPINIQGVLDSPTIKAGYLGASSNPGVFTLSTGGMIINPEIELANASVESASAVFRAIGAGNFRVTGGRLFGAGATTGQHIVFLNTSGIVELVGFRYPNTCTLVDTAAANTTGMAFAVAVDNTVGGALGVRAGSIDSRNDGYYPTLNAALPDSADTPWSWKVYPKGASTSNRLEQNIATLFSDTAATKTITLNLLVATDFTALNKGNLYLSVCYIDDATGLPKYLSTFDLADGALDSSTAGWSATTYGAVGLSKKKLSVTTPTAIKQDTPIIAVLMCTRASASANDIFFVCPDLVLS